MARKRRRNPLLPRAKREALSRELGGGLHADATVDELMAYMRSIESSGRIAYDDDLEDDPTTPKPELEDLWDELWANYGEDTLGNPYMGDAVELAKQRKYDEARRRWEREGRRGPPPAPPRSQQRRSNPAAREASLGRRISKV